MKFSFASIYNTIRKELGGFVGNLNKRLDILEKIVAKRVKSGENVLKAVTETMQQQNFSAGLTKDIGKTIVDSAIAGHKVNAGEMKQSKKPETSQAEKVPPLSEAKRKIILNKLTGDMWAPDQMKLSDRLHGAAGNVKRAIVDTVTSSIRNADTVKEMATKLYDGYNSGVGVLNQAEVPKYLQRMRNLAILAANGDKTVIGDLEKAIAAAERNINKLNTRPLKTSYQRLVEACKSGKLREKIIDRAVYVAVQEKSRYHAMRIARTESQRAWFQGFVSESQTDPLVFGYRWGLSSKHQYVPFDICDVFARMDVGFGRGIYYKNRLPLIPVHPHCGCMLYRVFVTDIDKSARFNLDKAREYLDSLPEDKKEALFGKRGLEAYKKDGDWQKHLIGWDGLKAPHLVLKNADFIDGTPDTIKRRMAKRLESLTADEKAALTDYTGNSSAMINRRLARGEKLLRYENQVKLLDSALEKGITTHDMTVYRKTIPEFLGLTGNSLLNSRGRVITENKYVSTSLKDFDYQGRNVAMKIDVPKGFKGALYIKDVAHGKYKGQEEVLFKRGLKMAIKKVRFESGMYYIDVEVVK